MSFTPKQVGDILRARQAHALEGERPQQATVSGTGSGVSNRGTTGQVRATLNRSGTTIWVDAGGNLTELAADDIILVEKIGDDTRAEWHMVDFFESSGGSRVPTVRADIKEQISEIWASDGDPQALDTDADGNMRVLVELDLDGKELIIDEDGDSKIYESSDDLIYVAAGGDVVWGWKTAGLALGLSKTIELVGNADALVLDLDGDTTISAPTDDEIDIEVGGSDVAEWKAGGLYGAAAMDVYPDGDDAPLFDRLINWGVVPGEHFRNLGDTLSWTGWASYTDYVTPSSLTYTPSLYTIGHSAGSLAFRYITVTPDAEEKEIMARVAITYSASIGIMIDDGVDTEDGEGADNFIRWYVTNGPSATRAPYLEYEYRVGGGAVTTVSYTTYHLMPQTFYGLWIATKNTEWTSWNPRIMIRGEADVSNEFLTLFSALPATQSWTPARVGIYYRNLATSANDKGVVDWFHHTF